jgi:uncharacterized phage protein (TIGR01671 family)
MREIKFRVWHKDGRKKPDKWMRGPFDLAEFANDQSGYEPENKYWDGYGDAWVFMQFTGLHDKNGKEIYEGDIIHEYVEADVDGKVEVATDEKFAVEWYCQDLDCGWTLFPVSCDGYEVIGNIYENTELLKETA